MPGEITTPFTPSGQDIERWINDDVILNVIHKKIKRLRREKVQYVLQKLIGQQMFKASELGTPQTIVRNNWTIFNITREEYDNKEYNKSIKKEEFIRIREEVINEIQYIEKNRKDFENDCDDTECKPEEKHIENYFIRKYVTFETIRRMVCDEAGKINLYYLFNTPDTELSTPQNTHILQRVKLQILSPGVKFDYPLIYKYRCEVCENESTKKAYEVVSSNTKHKCNALYTYMNAQGEQKTRQCGNISYPDRDSSINKDAYYYEIGYEDNNTKFSANAFTFSEYKPGFYECVMYKISSGRMELFFIVDVKKTDPNILVMPEQTKENYLFTLQKSIDGFILKQTGMEIYGLNSMKCALILQKLASILKERLILNIMMVGDPSTGKSMLLKYYSYLLYNYRNMTTNGLSVSIPGLRGTKTTINLFSKDVRIISIGHLGVFHSIHIDEAGENPELVQNLKSFLLEDDYSYDKAGSNGVSNERTAHINISQNLDYDHVGQYRGAIRKAYKEMNMTIDGVEKEEWNEEWDLFQPIHYYNNPQLRKIVKEKRLEYKQKQVFWLTGQELPLCERFPFFFYLINEKQDETLNQAAAGNASRKTLSKKLEVIRSLYIEDIDTYFETLKEYQFCDEDNKTCFKIDKIIKDYGYMFDTRTVIVFYMIARLSRILNKRMHYEEMDLYLVRWYLENINIKIDMVDTNNYNIKGTIDKKLELEKDLKEENIKPFNDGFGLPSNEFM